MIPQKFQRIEFLGHRAGILEHTRLSLPRDFTSSICYESLTMGMLSEAKYWNYIRIDEYKTARLDGIVEGKFCDQSISFGINSFLGFVKNIGSDIDHKCLKFVLGFPQHRSSNIYIPITESIRICNHTGKSGLLP